MKSAYYARDEVTAFYLAQEGLEFARVFRDQNFLTNQPGFTNFGYCTNVYCNIDFVHASALQCPNPNDPNSCPKLLVDSNGLFNTQSGTPSIFTRTIIISAVPGTTDEIAVKVRVSWVSAGIPRSFQLSEHLFNWL
ncbi:MAG: hypothetical protein JO187_14005 [Acidobacteria bacterium]|nr:hypothetical protein [Acidobacteriota bacterium]